MNHPVAVSLLIALACGGSAAAGGALPAADVDRTIALRVGEVAPIGLEDLRVGFDAVVADSRCPKDAQCVWAGDAVVRVWMQRGAGPREPRELHTAGDRSVAGALGYTLRLVRLDPVPIARLAGTNRDYVATLSLSAAPGDVPER